MPSDPDLKSRLRSERTLLLSVKVIPRASRSQIVDITPEGSVRLKVVAVPEKGKANQEVCRLLAEYFQVPKQNVEIVGGLTSSQKRVRITESSG